ncbi:uncharacterized protein C12orf56 homolog isoform X2 [Sarcophilus harrisii]|uniref:uncharacterized protein C12orf56 homolog isoform X2 n=1 Tax=Sarcophilus harrisii TaxID=9305 RepID=UPI001301D6D2|nr:uncharacterized protein C12orf56 homolog isoform X2 [Sarcophilus harrisii]
MAGSGQVEFPCRRNSRLDYFLKRHLRQEVYDAIRTYELCIVVSDTEHKTFKYVVLSDKFIYVTENPPRSIRGVVAFKDVQAIDLIDDYPDFLNGPDKEINQHIRIVYSLSTLKNSCGNVKGARKLPFPFPYLKVNKKGKEKNDDPSFQSSVENSKEYESINDSLLRYHQEDYSVVPSASTLDHCCERKKLRDSDQQAFRPLPIPSERNCLSTVITGVSGNSLSSVTNQTESILSCAANKKEYQTLSDQKNSQSEIQFKFSGNENDFYSGNVSNSIILPCNPNLEKKEAELHLYIISTSSSIFLHLKSSWNNYILKATLLQDPLYASKFKSTTGCQKPYRSEEMIKLFSQLKSELFLKDNTLGRIACLTAKLKVAAQKNFIFRKLFWKTSDLYYFLVSKLHEYLPKPQDLNALQNKSQRASQLEACIQIIQALGLMFRETETEFSRLNTLVAKRRTLITLLIILITEPEIPKSCPEFGIQFVADSSLVKMSSDAERLLLEYTNTATALLYEILLVSLQGNLGLEPKKFAISWIMSVLQSFPPTISFVASLVKQVMKELLTALPLLSPCRAVLLYQQFYILKSCLQHSSILAEYIRNNHKEEFRYFVHMPTLEKRLPLCYPITQTTTQLIHEVLDLIEQEHCVKCS